MRFTNIWYSSPSGKYLYSCCFSSIVGTYIPSNTFLLFTIIKMVNIKLKCVYNDENKCTHLWFKLINKMTSTRPTLYKLLWYLTIKYRPFALLYTLRKSFNLIKSTYKIYCRMMRIHCMIYCQYTCIVFLLCVYNVKHIC